MLTRRRSSSAGDVSTVCQSLTGVPEPPPARTDAAVRSCAEVAATTEAAAAARRGPASSEASELLQRLEAKWASAAKQLADIEAADHEVHRQMQAELASLR